MHPTMVPRQHLLADVNGAYNAIAVQGEALGASMYFGLGAGMMPTATAVVADLMDVARNLLGGSRGRVAPLGYPLAQQRRVPLKSMDDLVSEYYLRFMVVDRPGVLAKISGILGAHDISIASVIQTEREHGASVPIVIRTHEARERNLRRALQSHRPPAGGARQVGAHSHRRQPRPMKPEFPRLARKLALREEVGVQRGAGAIVACAACHDAAPAGSPPASGVSRGWFEGQVIWIGIWRLRRYA